MRVQQINVFAGTMLSVLVSAVTVYPASAGEVHQAQSGQTLSQHSTDHNMEMRQAVSGRIERISGDRVTLLMSNGTTRDITMPAGVIERMNLRTGMMVSMMVDNENMASNVVLVNTNTTMTSTTGMNTISGTITSVSGNMVMVRMMDGTTREIMMPAGEVERLKLEPGMMVSMTVDNQNMASSVNVTQSSTSSTVLRREEVVEQTRVSQSQTVEREQAPVSQETTVETRTTEVRQQTQVRPIRAMW